MIKQLCLENVPGKFIVCPSENCGFLNNPGGNFCANCGHDIKKEKPRFRLPESRTLNNGINTHAELGGLNPAAFRKAAKVFAKESKPGPKQINLADFPPDKKTLINLVIKHVGSSREYVQRKNEGKVHL